MKDFMENVQSLLRAAATLLSFVTKIPVWSPWLVVVAILKRFSKTIKKYADLTDLALLTKF